MKANSEVVLKCLAAATAALVAAAMLSACGGGSSSSGSAMPAATMSTVNLVVHDTPSPKLTVLSFQVEITAATLAPGNVSLLPRPITVDLAQLVSDTALLSSSVIGSTTYTSMTLSLANPQVTIANNSGAAITTPTQVCAIGAVCTFTPKLNTASVTISSGVFPITLTAGSSAGLALDLSIPDLLQSDLSITAADGTSVNLSLLPEPTAGNVQAKIEDVLGVVQSVSAGSIRILGASGETLVLTTDSGTMYAYPASVCAANDSSCVLANQIVTTDLTLLTAGGLHADAVSFAGAPNSTVIKGVIVGVGSGAAPTLMMVANRVLPSGTAYSPGDILDVTAESDASYSIGSTAFPAVSGASFAGAGDLLAGQAIIVGVSQATATGTDGDQAFTSGSIALQSSQILGFVGAVDSGTLNFGLTNVWSLFSSLSPAISMLQVQTGSQTAFVNLTPADLTAVTTGSVVRVKGPLFNVPTVGATLSAVQVSGRP